jgi:hypothetical protein
MKKAFLPILLAGIWITISEFVRNELLFKGYWVSHYISIGLNFQTLPINGILWMVWSFLLSYLIFKLIQKFSFWETIIISWITSFVMMWITIYNLQVLPLGLLYFAIPLSLLEVFIAGIIIKKFIK